MKKSKGENLVSHDVSDLLASPDISEAVMQYCNTTLFYTNDRLEILENQTERCHQTVDMFDESLSC